MSKFRRLISSVMSVIMAISAIPITSIQAEDSTQLYPYTMFASSNAAGAITVNAGNFCVNGNVCTNGTIVTNGNMNINGTKIENAEESMIFIFDKIENQYFSGSNIEEHSKDLTVDETNININVPTEVQGEAVLTGNININTAFRVLEDVYLYGEVKNTNDSIIFSEYGDINIDSQNVNLNGLVYAPFGCVNITAQNLNMNNVVIIADSILLTCPNVNANYSEKMGEFVGVESGPQVEPDSDDFVNHLLYAIGAFDEATSSLCIMWNSNFETDSVEILKSYDNDSYEYITTVKNESQYSYIIDEMFKSSYFKVTYTDSKGETVESNPFYIAKTEDGIKAELIDTDNDGVIDIIEEAYGSDITKPDTDDDGLTDLEEISIIKTDPIVYDSIQNGIADGEADMDDDGLFNALELELETNPRNSDTDGDDLLDGEEVNTYLTNPLLFDTDEDGLNDGFEICFGLNPLSAFTDGIADADRQIEQTITAENLTSVNTDDSPYELSMTITTNGVAAESLTVAESCYSVFLENDAQIGEITDLNISNLCSPEAIRLEYKIKAAYVDNTLNKYSEYKDLQGIKRLCVFKYFDEIGMMLPLETQYDIDKNCIFADVDELGTYCVMDLEIWLDLFDVEAEEITIPKESETVTEKNPAVYYLPKAVSVPYTTTRNNLPLDLVFIVQSAGDNIGTYNSEITLMEEVTDYVFKHYSDARVYVIDYKYDTANILKFGNRDYCTNVSSLTKGVSAIQYTSESRYCDTRNPFNLLRKELCLRNNVNTYIYQLHNGSNYYYTPYDDGIAISNSKLGIFSQVVQAGYQYTPAEYGVNLHNAIVANKGIDIYFSNSATTQVIDHIAANIDNTLVRTEYDALIASSLKEITLDAKIHPDNGVDTDLDTLTDWNEVMNQYIAVNADGEITLPTVQDLLEEIDTATLLDKAGNSSSAKTAMLNAIKGRAVLPCISDPTLYDTDFDDLRDDVDKLDIIPADSRFSLSDSTKYSTVPEIDFVNERYAKSEENYNSLVENDFLHLINDGLSVPIRLIEVLAVAIVTDAQVGVVDGGVSTLTSYICSCILAAPYSDADEYAAGLLIHAPKALSLYFSGLGVPIHYNEFDISELILSSENNIDHMVYNITQAMQYGEQVAIDNATVHFTSNSDAGFKFTCFDDKGKNCTVKAIQPNGHILPIYCNSAHLDWQITVGESFAGIRAEISLSGNTYTMKYRYYLNDIYEWTFEDPPDIGNVLLYFHQMGYAKQFLMDGYFEGTITWNAGASACDYDVYSQIMDTLKEIQGSYWGQYNESESYYAELNKKISYRKQP